MDLSVIGGAEAPASSARQPGTGGSRHKRAEHDRRRLTRRIIAGAIIVGFVIIGLTGATLWRLRQDQLDDGMSDLSALNLLVAAQTERVFESVDVLLSDISDDLQAQAIGTSVALRNAAGDEPTYRLLRAKLEGVPQLDALAIVSAEGDVINRSTAYPVVPQVNVAGRDYFLRLRDHPELKYYISPPIKNANGITTIYVGRRLTAANGAFLGIVLGAMRLKYIEGLYTDYLGALAGNGKSVALWRNDGTLLATVPGSAAGGTGHDGPTTDQAGGSLFHALPRNTDWAAFWVDGAHGQIAVAERNLSGFPLTLEARQQAAGILTLWTDESLATELCGLALLGLVGLATWLLLRQLRAEAQVGEARARADREVEEREDIQRAMAKAEIAMREAQQSEARFRDIAEVGSDWIWETDAEHRFTMLAGSQQPKVSLIGKTRWEVSAVGDDGNQLWREHQADLDARRPFRNFRFSRIMPDGRRGHFSVSGKPVFDEDGSFVGYRGTVANETELMEARERAERADQLLRNAINCMAEGFVIFDAEDRFVLCNDAYRQFYAENAESIVPGTKYEDIMRAALATGRYPDSKGREEEWLADWMQKHRTPGAPEEKQLANGRWVLVSEQRMADGGIAGLRIDITALKEAHDSLRESQFMLNCAQRVTATGSVMRDLKTNRGNWSDELYRIFGLSPTNFDPHTKGFLDRVHPEDRAQVVAAIADNKKGINDGAMQFRIIRPDGEIRWVYRETDILFDAAGIAERGLTTYRDITDKLANEARHRELETLLQDAIDSISEGFVIYDAEDRLVTCNDAYRRLYPESAEMMVPGARLQDIMGAALARGRYPLAKGREETWLAEQLYKHRELGEPVENQLDDGRWMLISERRTSSGGTAGLRVDITALKRVQQSLRDSQERLDRTQGIAHIGTIERDLQSEELAWSDETYRILGLDPGAIAPSRDNFLARLHPGDQAMMTATFRQSTDDHPRSERKFRIIRPYGEIRTIASQADLVRDADGAPRYISVALMDITDKETAAKRQRELETQLRHSEKLTALGTLAGGIAHDLNNTLVPIQALSKLVMREFPPEAQAYTDLKTINQASLQARGPRPGRSSPSAASRRCSQRADDLRGIVRNALQMLRREPAQHDRAGREDRRRAADFRRCQPVAAGCR